MENSQHSTMYYIKLFLLMIIPMYGLCFTLLLAFSNDVDDELKNLARGALVARIVFLFIIIILGVLLGTVIMPYLNNFLNSLGILRMFS